MADIVLALDVGGSSVKSGIVTPSLEVIDIQQTPVDSKSTQAHILGTFGEIVARYLAKYRVIQGIGIGFPSPFDYENGISLIEGVDKYEAIFNVDIGAAIREHIQRPDLLIKFRNDAEAALIGEAVYGAGQPYQRFIGLTLGTGLGSSFIVNRQRISSGKGIPENGFLFPVHYKGEQSDEWFSTRGLLNRLAEYGTPFETVADAAQSAEQDDTVRKAFASFGHDLAEFIAPYLQTFSAEALLITGGIANAYPLFREALEAGVTVPVVRGSLGTNAALLGAADLILNLD